MCVRARGTPLPRTYFTICSLLILRSSWRREISRIAVAGAPSSAVSRRIFLIATCVQREEMRRRDRSCSFCYIQDWTTYDFSAAPFPCFPHDTLVRHPVDSKLVPHNLLRASTHVCPFANLLELLIHIADTFGCSGEHCHAERLGRVCVCARVVVVGYRAWDIGRGI